VAVQTDGKVLAAGYNVDAGQGPSSDSGIEIVFTREISDILAG
jgi:hypothetical protein